MAGQVLHEEIGWGCADAKKPQSVRIIVRLSVKSKTARSFIALFINPGPLSRGGVTRTRDHLVPNQVRYQLRYTPNNFLKHFKAGIPPSVGLHPKKFSGAKITINLNGQVIFYPVNNSLGQSQFAGRTAIQLS
jgi:hypothetical protein